MGRVKRNVGERKVKS